MPRYRLTLEYDGGPFVGWQRQENGPSVQAALETALARFTRETPETTAAGRTDAGVHALGQVVHFDLSREWAPEKLRDALNFHLRPAPIVVVEAAAVADDFHARLSAIRRTYVFRILNRAAPPAIEAGRVWHVDRRLDVEAMHAAARCLVGHHDFTSFRATTCQAKSPMKTLDRLEVRRAGEEVHVDAVARSFLHHQVRNMVGTLKLVGDGKWSPADVRAALEARDRRAAGATAPPEGLYLVAVGY
ncbi:MAG: tRNA pseudouridine(38-40) synthase TruA [Alphaproteobacteria bacterium]|nr:tRNA pseudouridine(38-40) synthase TruA [Alphaproteobacteria bacterium]